MAEIYLNAHEVAEMLSVSEPTIWRWAREGHIPSPLKLGPKTSRWSSDEIAAHINRARDARESA